jgi:hypothetical protein
LARSPDAFLGIAKGDSFAAKREAFLQTLRSDHAPFAFS